MGKAKTLNLGSKEIFVRELTVKEIQDVIDACEKGDVSALDLLFPDIPSTAVFLSTGIDKEKIETMMPSEISQIVDAVKEVNPFFIQMLRRFKELVHQTEESLQKSSTEQSVG